MPERESQAPVLDKVLAFTFGVIFVSVLLYLATVEKNPTPLAIRVYVTVLALAAGGVGAILPGFLDLRYKNFIRAGGAIALAVLVYLNEPAIGKNIPTFVEPTETHQVVVDAFFSALDTGDPRRSWAVLPETARVHVNGREATWTEIYKNVITPLGHNESRALIGQSEGESLAGFPPGLYRTLTYKSKYLNDSGYRTESIVLRANSSSKWEMFTYLVSPITMPS